MIYIIYSFLTIILIIITYKNYFMSNQVVTIGYLKDFVNGKLTVSTDMPDTYCPTYGELTGGALVFNYSSASNPKDTKNGIEIPKCTVDDGYRSDQLVIRQDLLLKYMVLDSISIKADSNDIDKCGGSTNICVTGTFHLVTKSEDGETDGNAETDTTILASWGGNADNSGPSTCTVISFGLNAVSGIGTANPTSAPSRDKSTTATYTYSGTNLTNDNHTTKTSNTVTITQGANNVGEWYYVPSEDYATSLVASCPGIVSENGGTATVTSTLYYKQRWKADDSCGNIVGLKYIDASKAGPSDSHTFDEQECDAEERSATVTVSISGVSDSCVVTQEASSVPCYCGQSCGDVGCNGKIHWLCAEKKDTTQYDYDCSTAKVLNLNDKGQLPSSGGTATATVDGKSKKGIWTKSAYCSTESLPTQIVDSLPSLPNAESSQKTVYLIVDKEGVTGGTLYYNDSDGDTQSTYSYTYTSYTQYHYTVWPEDVQIGKKTIKEEKWGWKVLGTSYKRDANSATSYESTRYRYSCYSANGCDDKREEFINDGNSASSWDNAYSSWYTKWEKYQASEKFYCDGSEVPSEEEMLKCEGEQERRLDESLNPGEFYVYGYYYAPTTVYGDGTDSEMNRVSTCCVRNISTEKDYLVEHLSTPTDITTPASFTYQANTGATEITGTATLTLSGGRTCNVSYKVAPGSTAANNCATVEVIGRRWFISLANAAESDVTYSFNAKNGFEENGKKYEDWVQTITISKGSKTGSASSNLTQHATSATLSSVSPASDAKYNYNCISSIECEGTTDTYELVVTKEVVADTASAEEYMSVTSKKNGSPYKDFTFSESCSWVTGFQILNPNDTDGVYNVQITLQPNSEQGSRTCNGSVVQTNGKTETFSIVQNGNSSGGDNTGDCILGTTNTMQGGTGSKITLGTGKTTTVTIYSIDETGRCTTTPDRQIGDTSIVSSCTASSLSNATCSNTWTILAGNKTGSTNITFSNGCETFTLPIEVTGATEELSCNTLSAYYAGSNDFRVDFSESVTSDVTVTIKLKNADCELVNTVDITVTNGRKTGYGYNCHNLEITTGAYFEVINVSPTKDSKYIYWGGDCEYIQEGDCTPSTPCTCSVTNISVSPTTHTFTSNSSKSFSVTINDNSSTCNKCKGGFKVYNSSGTYVTSGTNSFSLSNQSGTFTIRANDNTGKTCTVTTTKYTQADTYVFSDNTPNTNLSIGYGANGSSMIVTSTKNSNMFNSITVSESCDWVTFGSTFTSGNNYVLPFNLTENTSTTERTCTVTATQGTSNKTLSWTIKQAGKPATCDCSTVSISCNPTNSYTNGGSVSTVVTVNAGSNCSTKWKAYSSSGSYLGEGESGKSLSRTTTGTVTFRSDACSGKTTTWTISKPECAKPTIRLSGSGDAYMLQNYSETDEWCGTNPNVSVSTSADYIGDGSDNTHYSPTTCSFEIANCAASITSFNLDSGGWILDSYSGLNSFGISFTIRPDAIMNATCRLRGSFTYLMQGTPFSGTFSISIQFNG